MFQAGSLKVRISATFQYPSHVRKASGALAERRYPEQTFVNALLFISGQLPESLHLLLLDTN